MVKDVDSYLSVKSHPASARDGAAFGDELEPGTHVCVGASFRSLDRLVVYLLAPTLGMLLAAEAFLRLKAAQTEHCAKINHADCARCIFCGPDRLTRAGMRKAA